MVLHEIFFVDIISPIIHAEHLLFLSLWIPLREMVAGTP